MRHKDIALTNVIGFVIGFGLFGAQSVIALMAQFKFNLDPFHTGLLLLPVSVVSLIMGPTVGLLVRRNGPKWPIVAGTVIPIIGFAYLYFFHATKTDLVIGITISGAGLSFAMVGSINMIIISTPQIETAISSAMNMIIRTVGGVVGPAVATVIISAHKIPVTDPGSGQTFYLTDDVAYQIVFMISAVVMVVGTVLAVFLTNKKSLGEGKGFAVNGKPVGSKGYLASRPEAADPLLADPPEDENQKRS
jgi:MFS family permease